MIRRYFDNAATSFPKPPGVAEAMRAYLEDCGASAGRAAYREALEAGRLVDECRAAVRRLFNARPTDHVVFGHNGTDALNCALKGLLRPGEHVVTTTLDHNSVLRPLTALEARIGVRWTAVAPPAATTLLDPQQIGAAILPQTALVVINHASNVTGALQPIEPIAAICRERGVPLLLDAAQTAGHTPIDFAGLGIDLLACPGHKGLLGPPGTGVLLVRGGFDSRLVSQREGGTGSASEQPSQPDFLPDKLESGSHNAVGLAGLLAALRWLLESDEGRADQRANRTRAQARVDTLHAHEQSLCTHMLHGLDGCSGVTFYGPRDARDRVGVFSVRIEGLEPVELSAILEERFGLLTRSGLHCAPLAHRTIGTLEHGGTTRFSFGPFTTAEDVDAACAALREIAEQFGLGE